MQRSMSVVQTRPNQYVMNLPIKWVRCRNMKARDLIMIFSENEYSSPLVLCSQKEYMKNPYTKKLVDKIIKILEKYEEVI